MDHFPSLSSLEFLAQTFEVNILLDRHVVILKWEKKTFDQSFRLYSFHIWMSEMKKVTIGGFEIPSEFITTVTGSAVATKEKVWDNESSR